MSWPGRQALWIATVLVPCVVLAAELPDDESQYVFEPEQFKICSTNFASHPDLSLEDCQVLCQQSSQCTQFSFPLKDAATGCRLGKEGGCHATDIQEKGYAMYHKKKAPQDEPPDVEGTGARRRRRTDARRRTHNLIRTDATEEMNSIVKKQKEEAMQVAKHAEEAAVGAQTAKLYHKEKVVKKDVEVQILDKKIKEKLKLEVSGGGGGGEAEDGGGVSKEFSMAEAKLEMVKNEIANLKAQTPVFQANIQAAQGVLDVTDARRQVVAKKIRFAEESIQKLMTNPGNLADNDRMIAIAILGKLRVARALVSGDLPALDENQRRVDWVANLKDTMMRAIRNPSGANMAEAQAAYKTASALDENAQANELNAENNEAKELEDKENVEQEAAKGDAKQQEVDKKLEKEKSELARDVAIEQAQAEATQEDPTAPPPAINAPQATPQEVNAPIINTIPRGYYDPPEEGFLI